jgi:enoyl-CoA hydratase/carnithine racemase
LTEPDDLLPTAITIANSYAANPDLQLRMTKQLLTENVVDTDLRAIQQREHAMLADCWKSPEHKEAVAAFLEKRPPVFRPAVGDE